MYKVKIDLTAAMEKISDMGIKDILKGAYWIKVHAKDPDAACHAAREKVYDTVHKKWGKQGKTGEEAIDIIREEMKIVKIEPIY
jgi:hypothetical protein